MPFPVDTVYESRSSGSTIVKSAWANASDAALNGVYGATKTLVGVDVDGSGYLTAAVAAGSIRARSGQVIAGGNIQSSGGIVLGTKLASTNTSGGTGLELRSGTGVVAYHATGKALVSGNVTVGIIGVPVLSGKAVAFFVRGVGVATARDASMCHTTAFTYLAAGNTPAGTVQSTVSIGSLPTSGDIAGGVLPIITSGTVTISVVGTAAKYVDWTVYADMTVAP